MKTMKFFVSSSLALCAMIVLVLFTSCSVEGKNDPIANEIHTPANLASYIADAGHPEEMPADTHKVDGMSVAKSVICSGIENREPVGIGTSFSLDVGKVWFYTRIEMPKGKSGTIKHVWKRDGKVISTVELSVKGPSFRTRSYKTITKHMKGNWTVDVVNESGNILQTDSFVIE